MALHTLEDGVHDPLLFWAATPTTEINWDWLIDLEQSGLLINHMKLVLVHELVIARAELTNGLIALIEDGGMAMAMAICRVVVTLKAEQHVLALPTSGLEVGRPDGIVRVSRPDKLAVIAEDVWALLAWSVELRLSPLTREGCYEEVPFLHVLGCRDRDVQSGWCKVCTRLELPVGSSKRYQGCRAGDEFKNLHDGEELDQRSVSMMPFIVSSRGYINLGWVFCT